MKIKRGTSRTVFVFNHVVVKLPVIDLIGFFKASYYEVKNFFKSIKKNGLKRYYQKRLIRKRRFLRVDEKSVVERSKIISLQMLHHKKYEIFGLRRSLFGGIMANWNEYLFYRETKNSFVMPTYFSLFGLINIQKRGQEITFWSYTDVWMYICHNSANKNQPFCNSHSFAEKENFCLDGDKLKMLDYGSRHVHNFLRLNGNNLFNNFVKPPL